MLSKFPPIKAFFFLTLLALSIMTDCNAAANFLTDSGFEEAYAEAGETFTDDVGTPISSGSVWIRSTGTCDAWAGGPRNRAGIGAWGGLANGLPAVPNEGGNFAACGGWYPPGERITQRVTGAVPGKTYELSFWYAHAGVEGLTPDNFLAQAGVWIDGVLLGKTEKLPYLGAGKQVWKKATFKYTPSTPNFDFTIGYKGIIDVVDYGYIAFDGVSVSLAPNMCFAMTDNIAELYKFDLDISTPVISVPTSRTLNGEASTYRATDDAMYTFHQDLAEQDESQPCDLYKVTMDGTVSLVKANFLPRKANGAEFVRYSDGSERFYTLQYKPHSEISVFDAADLSNNVPLKTVTLKMPDGTTDAHVDGLAINPKTGEVLVIDDHAWEEDPTDRQEIYSVNMTTGQLTLVTTLINDIDGESLAFAEDGKLYTEEEDSGSDANYHFKLYRIDLATGGITAVENFPNDTDAWRDIEGMSCTGSKIITPAPTTITVVTKIINDNGGTNGINDMGVSTSAGSLIFDGGQFSGATNTTTYTANDIETSAGTITVTAPVITGYTHTNALWSCTSGQGMELITQNSITGNNLVGQVTIANGDQVTCTVVYDDNNVCRAYSGEVNVALSPISMFKYVEDADGKPINKLFMAITNNSDHTGHLKAYPVGANETPAASAVWDATAAGQRADRLYSSVGTTKTLFNALPDASFTPNTMPDAAMVKSAVASAVMGAISPKSNIVLLQDDVDPLRYLSEPDYQSFYRSTIANRSAQANATVASQVLVTSDDGFIYSLNQSTGDLNWGWMPASLVKQKYDASFNSHHYMKGVVDQLDLKSGSLGSYSFASYIVGSYKDGLGQYVLKIANDSRLASVIWDTDHTLANSLADAAPNQGKRAYFKDANGIQYMAYIITSGTDSVLHIRSMTDNSRHEAINLGFTATATPFVMPDFRKPSSPLANTLYLGDNEGHVYAAALFESGNVTLSTNLSTDFSTSATPVATIQPANQSSSEVLYIGASIAVGGRYYLQVQSNDRLTLFQYLSTSASWNPGWTTSTASGLTGKWVTTDGVTSFATDATIRSLPIDAMITGKAYVIANSIVLPVTLPPATNSCENRAYYYLYELPSGHTPSKTFYTTRNIAINSGVITLGKGDAQRIHLTVGANTKKLIALGLSDQDINGDVGLKTSFYVNDPVTSGIRSWKELH